MSADVLAQAAEIVNAALTQGLMADVAAELDSITAEEKAEALTEMVPELLAIRLSKLDTQAQVDLLTRILALIMKAGR